MEQIKILRECQGLTQEALAALIGIKRENISRYESGERNPPIKVLVKMARIFGVTVDELIGDPDS